jgi:hypothetical protein
VPQILALCLFISFFLSLRFRWASCCRGTTLEAQAHIDAYFCGPALFM